MIKQDFPALSTKFFQKRDQFNLRERRKELQVVAVFGTNRVGKSDSSPLPFAPVGQAKRG